MAASSQSLTASRTSVEVVSRGSAAMVASVKACPHSPSRMCPKAEVWAGLRSSRVPRSVITVSLRAAEASSGLVTWLLSPPTISTAIWAPKIWDFSSMPPGPVIHVTGFIRAPVASTTMVTLRTSSPQPWLRRPAMNSRPMVAPATVAAKGTQFRPESRAWICSAMGLMGVMIIETHSKLSRNCSSHSRVVTRL